MNLDKSFANVKSNLISCTTEPTLEEVKSILSASAEVDNIKTEESIMLAMKNKQPKKSNKIPTQLISPSTDEKGLHWCDLTNEGHCHCCGRKGHIAARCITDMPQEIKDWVLGRPKLSAHAAFGDNPGVEEVECVASTWMSDDGYETN
ncbi:hypothetical protein Clacol_009100 [Clathrus columnatus]|uniref:CCHC-type domain-containing protein n=1 Tax=Clathrus columnatus TaxID=1419009 RepID=A0AAV5AM90_9AGAM|nr:hypothetical protein Clacol_009100 [Clathrus columnatus]